MDFNNFNNLVKNNPNDLGYESDLVNSMLNTVTGSNPYSGALGELNQIEPLYNKYLSKAESQINPFYKAGTSSINPYQDLLSSMSNPSEYQAELLKDYQNSPYAQNQINEAIKAANAASAAEGMLGSPAEQKNLSEQVARYVSGDQQQYLNNLMGINDRYRSGLGGLMGQGLQASNMMGNWDMNTVNALARNMDTIAGLKYGQKTNQDNQTASMIGSLIPLAGFFL